MRGAIVRALLHHVGADPGRVRVQFVRPDVALLDRSTHTIIQQVDAMKEMVDAFSQYARTPSIEFESIDLNALLSEVADLYRAQAGHIELNPQYMAEDFIEHNPNVPSPVQSRVQAHVDSHRRLLHQPRRPA